MVENWTELIIGAIMIVSPWVFGFADLSVAKWCDVLLGLALVVVNAWTLFERRPSSAAAAPEETKKRKAFKTSVEPKITA